VNRGTLHPWFFTRIGLALAPIALIVWILSFGPCPSEISDWCFPLSRVLLAHLFPNGDIPGVLWFGSALAHWPVIGLVIDLVRRKTLTPPPAS
jgi:hypothetical protein